MSRPLLEVADLVRSAGAAFIGRNQAWIAGPISRSCSPSRAVAPPHSAVNIDECTRCGHRATISYNSCPQSPCPSVRRALANAGSRHDGATASLALRPCRVYATRRNWLRGPAKIRNVIYGLLLLC